MSTLSQFMPRTEYAIFAGDQCDVVVSVASALADGWKLQGGVSVAVNGDGYLVYAQAVVRVSAPEPSPEAETDTY